MSEKVTLAEASRILIANHKYEGQYTCVGLSCNSCPFSDTTERGRCKMVSKMYEGSHIAKDYLERNIAIENIHII